MTLAMRARNISSLGWVVAGVRSDHASRLIQTTKGGLIYRGVPLKEGTYHACSFCVMSCQPCISRKVSQLLASVIFSMEAHVSRVPIEHNSGNKQVSNSKPQRNCRVLEPCNDSARRKVSSLVFKVNVLYGRQRLGLCYIQRVFGQLCLDLVAKHKMSC